MSDTEKQNGQPTPQDEAEASETAVDEQEAKGPQGHDEADEATQPQVDAQHDDAPGFEPDDVPVGMLVTVGVVLTAIVLVSFVMAYELVKRETRSQMLDKGFTEVEVQELHGGGSAH